MGAKRPWRVLFAVAMACWSLAARAQSSPTPAAAPGAETPTQNPNQPADAKLEQSREYYRSGLAQVQQARWGEALAAFEKSRALRPHAITTFNIGACERALGHYTRARAAFEQAVSESQTGLGELPEAHSADAKAFIEESKKILALVTLSIEPAGARISIDGRPLTRVQGDELAAGLSLPGEGGEAPRGKFKVRLDPGVHVITLRRRGYSDVVVNRTFASGSETHLPLSLDRLPATLRVASTVTGALVKVNGVDVGPAPVDVLRPPGLHLVVVSKPGFEPYETSVNANAGEEVNLKARLAPEKSQLTKKWWFWTSAAAVLAGGAVLTYALTRPEPAPPPYDGGSTGWVVYPGKE
jgi:hypothetical protein